MKVYHGEEGEWLKLQALQLMLRLQVQKMREIWLLPDVFEVSLSIHSQGNNSRFRQS